MPATVPEVQAVRGSEIGEEQKIVTAVVVEVRDLDRQDGRDVAGQTGRLRDVVESATGVLKKQVHGIAIGWALRIGIVHEHDVQTPVAVKVGPGGVRLVTGRISHEHGRRVQHETGRSGFHELIGIELVRGPTRRGGREVRREQIEVAVVIDIDERTAQAIQRGVCAQPRRGRDVCKRAVPVVPE